jgi:endonuclease/exonuclease/phosphatase family metal-dependent hydrolase
LFPRPWRFDSPAFRPSPSASELTVVTYNTSRERNGRDRALESILSEQSTLVCLQEVSPARAWRTLWALRSRAFVSLGKYGLLYLALVLPEGAEFLERRTASLNGYGGVFPRGWSLRRSYALRRAGRRAWVDGLEPRVAQVARVLWRGVSFRVVHIHLPYEPWLRDRCLEMMPRLLGEGDALLVGDLNATTRDLFLGDLLLRTGLRPAGDGRPTHRSGRTIDFVLYRGRFREAGYGTAASTSDHRLVRTELEV